MYANMAVEAFSLFSVVADWLILFVCLQLIKGAQIKPISKPDRKVLNVLNISF